MLHILVNIYLRNVYVGFAIYIYYRYMKNFVCARVFQEKFDYTHMVIHIKQSSYRKEQ